MAIESIDFIRNLSAWRVHNVPLDFKRSLYDCIDWADRLIMIKGARGTGKTTLMLQHMREHLSDSEKGIPLWMFGLLY